jgi:hypothetical protein
MKEVMDTAVEDADAKVEEEIAGTIKVAPATRMRETAFKGNMKGNVFQCHGENTDKQQFPKTIGVLKQHINKTFAYPQEVASVYKSFKIVPLVQPPNLTKVE